MKNIIVFTFLFVALTVSAQDIPDDDTTARPAITEAGKPTGRLVQKMMNKDGGTLVSANGKVELIIPSGALSKKTSISIQPVTNMMPNGNGLAYRLEPSGIQFKQPVQIVFHYDPEESEDTAQLLMGIAMQDDKGQWYGLNKFTLDTVAKTISGYISHFSIWATFDKLRLMGPTRVKVKKKQRYYIYGVDVISPEDREAVKQGKNDPYLTKEILESIDKTFPENFFNNELSPLKSWKPPQKGIWRVNNIIKGNDVFGTLMLGKVNEFLLDWNYYTAPANIPDENPVTISVDLVGASFKINGQTFKNLKLKTKVLIFDNAYEVIMECYADGPAVGNLGSVTYDDYGSFVVSLNGTKTKIIEKLNHNTDDEFIYKEGNCTYQILKPGPGYLNIIGNPVITVIPATSTEPARVKIQFKRVPLILPLLQFTCPDMDGHLHTTNTAMANAMFFKMMTSYPNSIEFTAKEDEEEWEIFETEFNVKEGTKTKPGDKSFLKYTIRKLKDEGF